MQSFEGYTKSYDNNCFSLHIKESIEINQKRKPIYSKLTDGQSDKIFNVLLSGEYLSLIPAKYYDFKSRLYQDQGVPLFCYEFMSMHATPDFDPDNRVIPQEEFLEFDWVNVKAKLDLAVKDKDFVLIKKISLKAIHDLDKFPHYYCMLRHIFESIYRFAYFLPLQIEASEKAGLKSPLDLTMEMIKLQILSLVTSNKIDHWSAPIQKSGIPILCSELPRLLEDLDI